jgi:hypothetical protein
MRPADSNSPYNDHSPVQPPKSQDFSQSALSAESAASAPAPADEPMLYCPVCSTRLDARKCKLFCAQCGYYMSCADYI